MNLIQIIIRHRESIQRQLCSAVSFGWGSMLWTMMKRERFFVPSTEERASKNWHFFKTRGKKAVKTAKHVRASFFWADNTFNAFTTFSEPVWKSVGDYFLPNFSKSPTWNPVMGNLNQTPVSPLLGDRFGRFDFVFFRWLDSTQKSDWKPFSKWQLNNR